MFDSALPIGARDSETGWPCEVANEWTSRQGQGLNSGWSISPHPQVHRVQFLAPACFQIQKQLHPVGRTLAEDIIDEELPARRREAMSPFVSARKSSSDMSARSTAHSGLRAQRWRPVSDRVPRLSGLYRLGHGRRVHRLALRIRTSIGPILVRYLSSSRVLRCFGVGR